MRYRLGCATVAALAAVLPATAVAVGDSARLPVEITFALTEHGKEVGCGAPLTDLGTGGTEAALHEARLYVHGVNLIDAKGKRVPVTLTASDWQYADVALLDFKDARGGRGPCSTSAPAKNTTIVGTAPKGTYSGLEFSVGVPVSAEVDGRVVSLNHSNTETAPAPLDIAAMGWSWQAGRKFIMIEVDPKGGIMRADGGRAKTWMVHLGSTGCKGNPATGEIITCARPNRFTIALDRFDSRKQRVTFDLGKLFEGSNLAGDKSGAIGCMSGPDDPECGPVFAALGLALGDSQAGSSTIFSVGAKP